MAQSVPDVGTPAPPVAVTPGHSTKRRLLLPFGVVLAIAGTAAGIWYLLSRPSEGTLQISGRIEGYETDVGAKVGGRVKTVAVREGDPVKQGQLIAQLDDDEIQAQLQGAAARIAAAEQQARQARLQIDVIDNQLREAQLNVLQSQQDNHGRIYQAQANVAALEAQLKQAESQLSLARLNRDRFARLWRDGAIAQQQYDQAQTTYDSALASVEAVQKQIEAARGALAIAQTSNLNPAIRRSQLAALTQQRQQAIAQLQAAQADIQNAQATQKQIQAQRAYLNVLSPIDGVVTARTVEPGAVVASGKTLLSLINLNTVYLRGFVPGGEIGKVRVGQPARVFLDSNPKQPLKATVSEIDSQASFTPENVYFKDDRVRQVFGVKLAIEQPDGFAKPGMPADAEILRE
jgi:HlyD family secretion protein